MACCSTECVRVTAEKGEKLSTYYAQRYGGFSSVCLDQSKKCYATTSGTIGLWPTGSRDMARPEHRTSRGI